ncbi:MAG TPA: pilus assembly protein N-terminal domain-containing protein, partial [Stellaceae bacterium]|nr:pilus assembly protein N-terminal domain-containing protein [Stellaceae bacterium]
MIRKFLVLMAVTASAAMLSVAADAANTAAPATGTPAKPEAPAAAGASEMTQVAPKGPAIVIEAGKGTLISLQRSASTVFIANPTIADVQVKSPKLIYVTAKVPGETVLYAVDADDHVLLNAPVRVEQDLTRMRETLSAIAPGENVNVSSVNNSVVLSGKVSSAGNAEKMRSLAASIADETKGHVINRLSVATPNQVNIRVKVAEVDRNVAKDLGLNWSRLGNHLNFSTSNPTLSGDNVLSFALGGASSQLLGTLDILANDGFLTTLAEPNLTATNGQPASFLAGGEFPVPVIGSGTAGTTGVAIQSV